MIIKPVTNERLKNNQHYSSGSITQYPAKHHYEPVHIESGVLKIYNTSGVVTFGDDQIGNVIDLYV